MTADFKVVDYDGEDAVQVTQKFAGRLMSSDFLPIDNGKEKVSLHKVHIDLALDTEQYIQLLKCMSAHSPFFVELIDH